MEDCGVRSSHGCFCCSSGSLQEEQKMLLLQRFKLLCLAGLEAEGNPLEGGAETTLVRCNCCYNLPVGSGMSKVRDPLADLTHPCFLMSCVSRQWCCSQTPPTSCQSSTHLFPACVATRRSACDAALPPVSTRLENYPTKSAVKGNMQMLFDSLCVTTLSSIRWPSSWAPKPNCSTRSCWLCCRMKLWR